MTRSARSLPARCSTRPSPIHGRPSGPSHRDRHHRYSCAGQYFWTAHGWWRPCAACGSSWSTTARRRGPADRLRGHALRCPGAAPRPQQGPGGGAQHRPGGVRHRLRGVPRLRRGAAARVAGGAARPLLRPRRGAGRAAHRRGCDRPTTWSPATRRCARRSTSACARRRWCPTARCHMSPAPRSSVAGRC